jgi:hypothetical protein
LTETDDLAGDILNGTKLGFGIVLVDEVIEVDVDDTFVGENIDIEIPREKFLERSPRRVRTQWFT